MPLSNPITEPQIPQPIARDAEFQAASAAHVNATDPHLQYPTQARGDARYIGNEQGLILKVKHFFGLTHPDTGNANFPHGLDTAKIRRIDSLINGYPPGFTAANFGGSAEYNIFFVGSTFYIVCGVNRTNLLNKPYFVEIEYLGNS